MRTSDFPILDFEWLCECFRCNEIADPNIYSIFFIFRIINQTKGLFKQFTSPKTLSFIKNTSQDEAILLENPSSEKSNTNTNKDQEKKEKNSIDINKNSFFNIEKTEKNIETQPLSMSVIEEENKQQIDLESSKSAYSGKSIGSEALEEINLKKSLDKYNEKKDFFNICSRYLIDYSYDSDENELSHSIEPKKEEPFVINSEDEKCEKDSDIEFLGSNKIEKKENGFLIYLFF